MKQTEINGEGREGVDRGNEEVGRQGRGCLEEEKMILKENLLGKIRRT